jgi:hypothetical protein
MTGPICPHEPPEKAIEGQGVYRDLIELMALFCLECEWLEAKETKGSRTPDGSH